MVRIDRSKGFTDIMWVSLMMLLMMIFMIAASEAATIFSGYSRALVSTNQGYYDAEAGIYRAKWYIEKNDVSKVPTAVDRVKAFTFDVNNDNADDTTVTITYTAAAEYNIVATSNTFNRTITAVYKGGTIISLT